MDGTAVKAISELAQQAAGNLVTIDGVNYSTTPLHDVRKAEPEPTPIGLATLSGLVGYLSSGLDKAVTKDGLLIHVDDPQTVLVLGPLTGRFQQRYCYARAHAEDLLKSAGFAFDKFTPVERAVMLIQALFVDTGDRAEVLRTIGSLRDENITTLGDDGVTQGVTVKAGIAIVEQKKVLNPVKLAPYRTFPEVSQPVSEFVVRMRKMDQGGIGVALIPSDGNKWQAVARESICAYLAEKFPAFRIVA